MRIIAGKHRGRNLKELKAQGVRPTLDRVRENLFNILSTRIVDCTFLDLFAGSGAIGFEAISRGAEEVVFVDASRQVVSHLKDNLTMLKESATVLNCDYKSALGRLSNRIFDIVYLDPPYDFDEEELLNSLSKSSIIDETTLIIYEHKAENPLKNTGNYFIITDERKYGIATLSFLRKNNEK